MCHLALKCVVLFSVVFLWTAESANLFAHDLFDTSNFYSVEVELTYDQDDLETRGLPARLASCTEESVSFYGEADHCIQTSELHSVSRWHLRGPPIG
jgi:hypothetical protein